jgi:cytochrome c-type biogenesis protein CcsB
LPLSALDLVIRITGWAGAALAAIASALTLRAFFDPDHEHGESMSRVLLVVATVFMTATIVARAAELGTVPLSSPLESLFTYGWLVFFVYLLLVQAPERPAVGTLLVPFGTLCALAGIAGLAAPADVEPILKNPLFAFHALAAFLGYSALSVACCAGILYLVLHDQISHKRMGRLAARLPSLEDLDALGHRTVISGLTLLTASIVAGMVWAKQEWGVLWIWEPKGVWALLTWVVYAFYLVARNSAGWRGVRAAWVSALGFVATIFTLLGTNYLLGWGRHVF